MHSETKTPLLTNRLFDALKFLAQILLPAAGTLYFALADVWGLPNADQVVGTVVAVDTFLGVILGLQTRSYNASDSRFDGNVVVYNKDDTKTFSLQLNSDPDTMDQKNELLFKVVSN